MIELNPLDALQAVKDVAADTFASAKESLDTMIKNEGEIAKECIFVIDKDKDAYRKMLEKDGLNAEDEERIWHRISAMEDKQIGVHKRQIGSDDDKWAKVLGVVGGAVLVVAFIANPELGKTLPNTIAKRLAG